MATFHMAIRMNNSIDDYRANGKVTFKELYIASEDINFYTESIEEFDKWCRDNINESSEILVYGDKGLHHLLLYLKNKMGESKINEWVSGTKLKAISWKREVQVNKKRKKYTIKFINIQPKYPTLKLDKDISIYDEISQVHGHMEQCKGIFDKKATMSTLAMQAMKKWKESSRLGQYIGEWLLKPLLDKNGDCVINEKTGKEIFVPDFETWEQVKLAFNGGFLWTNKEFQMKHLKGEFYHYDMNSMYTHIMESYKHPVGYPQFSEEIADLQNMSYKLYKVVIEVAETDSIPFIAINNDFDLMSVHEDHTGSEKGKGIRVKNRPKKITNQVVHMNNYTLEKFEKDYKGTWSKTFLMAFAEEYDLFADYNADLMKLKELWNDDKEMRGYIKQALNTPYGKNAQKPSGNKSLIDFDHNLNITTSENGVEYVDGKRIDRNENLIYYKEEHEYTGKLSYIPLSQSISSKAELLILSVVEKFKENVMYIDTDGFITNRKWDTLDIHNTKIGAWKLDAVYKELVIRGPKHYYGYTDDGYILKGAGIQSQYFGPHNMPLEKYVEDEVVFEGGQYMRIIVDGGVLEFRTDLKLINPLKVYTWKDNEHIAQTPLEITEEDVNAFFV